MLEYIIKKTIAKLSGMSFHFKGVYLFFVAPMLILITARLYPNTFNVFNLGFLAILMLGMAYINWFVADELTKLTKNPLDDLSIGTYWFLLLAWSIACIVFNFNGLL